MLLIKKQRNRSKTIPRPPSLYRGGVTAAATTTTLWCCHHSTATARVHLVHMIKTYIISKKSRLVLPSNFISSKDILTIFGTEIIKTTLYLIFNAFSRFYFYAHLMRLGVKKFSASNLLFSTANLAESTMTFSTTAISKTKDNRK